MKWVGAKIGGIETQVWMWTMSDWASFVQDEICSVTREKEDQLDHVVSTMEAAFEERERWQNSTS